MKDRLADIIGGCAIGILFGFIVWIAGAFIGDRWAQQDAVKNNAAYYAADKDGTPKFTWGCK